MAPQFYTDPSITLRRTEQPDVLSRFIQLQQLADDQRFNKLREREALLRLKELERQAIEAEAMRGALGAGVQPGFNIPASASTRGIGIDMPTRFNPQAALEAIAQSGQPHLAPELEQTFATQQAEQQKARLNMAKEIAGLTKTQLENATTRVNLMAQMADSVVRSPETYPQVRAAAVEQGFISPDQWPEQLTPELLPRLEAVRQQSKEIREAVERERHNRATEVPEAERSFKSFYQTWLEARGAKPNAALELEARKEFAQSKTSQLLTPEEEAQRKRISQAGKTEPTVVIQTVDERGLPVSKIVPKRVGAEYPKPPTEDVRRTMRAKEVVGESVDTMKAAVREMQAAGNVTQAVAAITKLNAQLATLGQFARGISGEVGVLMNQDIDRIRATIPSQTELLGSKVDPTGLLNTRIKEKLANLDRMVASLNRYVEKVSGGENQPKVDPLGLR